jgi:hypothetical protein
MEINGLIVRSLVGSADAIVFANAKPFRLSKINLVKACCPAEMRGTYENRSPGMPIVVASNRHHYGRVLSTDYCPSAVIVAGAARRDLLLRAGHTAYWAWVEAGAMEIKDGNSIGSNQLLEMLNVRLKAKLCGPTRLEALPGQSYPYIVEVYPFESYFVYDYKGEKFRQAYLLDPREQTVQFSGPSVPVKTEYVNANGRRPTLEILSQTLDGWSNMDEAVQMYLDAIKYGLYTPMAPAFSPVQLASQNRLVRSLASRGIGVVEFCQWSWQAKERAKTEKTKSVGGTDVPRSKFAYVGDPSDPSTWHLPVDTPGRARNALARINQTHGIPASEKPKVLDRIRRQAKHHGVDVSEKPTPGQKEWTNKKVAAVTMTKPDFVHEHKHLVKVLRKGSQKEREKEAKDQAHELAEVV